MNSKGIELYDISDQIAFVAAQYRAEFGFKTPDALQLATALEYNADYFLTNDKKLKVFSKIPVLTLDDLGEKG